ncbi:MAG: hypothetical protein UX37_C0020G0004 [Microgenomates group bacterium GW2011_GWA2_46_16]|nr:MAG: hypothetical protein UX37_C0020G0004 [Microgenomates group bacterium GW2011_GWA2_46_16]
MLITRPNHDITTNYLFYWSTLLIEQAKKSGKVVTDLNQKRANAKEFASVVKKTRPAMIVLNGHGDHSTVTGYDNEPLVTKNDNPEILAGTVVFARACQSALELGEEAVKRGCKAYIGYNDDFVFVTEDGKETHPLQDSTAKLFIEPSNHVVISLLKGHSPSEANSRSRAMCLKTIQKLMSSSASQDDSELVPNLAWNYAHQVCLEK